MAFWDRFFGSAGSTAAGVAIGATAVPSLTPAVQFLENEAWALHPDKPPTVYTLVQGVAKGQIPDGEARTWAHQQGINDAAFDALVAGSHAGPPYSELVEAYRRGLIGDTEFSTGLRRLEIEEQWWPALRSLRRQLLSPAEAANARQQQFISDTEQRAIAADYGIEPQDADVQFELAGLPPGVETALEMWRRGIIDQATFDQIVAEGHTKTKYTADLEALKQRVLNAAVYVRLFLKGHITRQQMHDGGALWGYSPTDMDQWELAEGRPATVHEIHIGYARGATLPGAANEQAAVRTAVAESDIRPEYADLLWAGRYTYPSAFVLRSLTAAGDITEAEAHQILLYEGWEPTLAAKVAASWAGGTTGTSSDPHVSKAETQLWTATHKAYLNGEAPASQVTANLNLIGVPAAAQPQVLALWQAEQATVRKGISAAQYRTAYRKQDVNDATGLPWTLPEAQAELQRLGYSPQEAHQYLEIG